MDFLHDGITTFGNGERPHENELVAWDGFDQLDKESALQFFSGKTWRDVLSHLRGLKEEPLFGAAYFLEEWTVLSPSSLAYYARAYVEHLRETLASPHPDEEFIFYFLGALCQVAHMGTPFDPAQTSVLRTVVQQTAAASGALEYFADDIKHQAEQFLTATAGHHS
jgi:hypothetical protein